MHSTSTTLTSTDGNNNNKLSEEGKNYLAVPLKRKIIELSDVPSQPPIPKRGRIKDGASKYTGVTFHKQSNKWLAQIIMIEKKPCCIGYYESEEEAAADYARALFKYKGQGALEKARKQNTAGRNKEGASKYTGVSFHKQMNKWQAQIQIEGKKRCIGFYENEEEAAVDYARAVFKYKCQGALDKAMEFIIDLSDISPQLPIPKSAGRIKEGASKYTGVSFNKQKKKWKAEITVKGKSRFIGSYDDEEEAAVDYARAVFKYKVFKYEAQAD
ncbi:AP2/ERF family transcription factor [Skeletonema marinoi]|uniref:AP2/ERF family transcription factor n=1 Tax=Skeletonema marinoi TaxID=267567 RepID=A0AAD8YAN3_9STRA|nr:AP2/ERF family transcription factor [Skeletonema marinoi]